MPRSPAEEAEYQQLGQQLGYFAPPAPVSSLGAIGRIGEGFANLPSNVGQGLINGAIGLSNIGQPPSMTTALVNVPKPYDIPAPQNFGQRAADIIPGLAATIGTALLPGGIATKALSLMGAEAGTAAVLGDTAAGVYLGAGQPDNTSASTGAEFGAQGLLMRAPIPGYLKALGMAAIPMAGEAARGGDPFSQGSLMSGIVSAAVPGLLGHYADSQQPRSLLSPSPEATSPSPAPSPTDYTQSLLQSRANEARNADFQGPLFTPDVQGQLLSRQQNQTRANEARNADFVGPVPNDIDPSIAPSAPDDRSNLDAMAETLDQHTPGLAMAVSSRPGIIQQDPLFAQNPDLAQTAQQYADTIASHKASIGDIPTDDNLLDRHGLPLPSADSEASFPDWINHFASEAPDTAKQGGNVLLSHLYDRARGEGIVADRADFDNHMIDAHNDGLINMRTSDVAVPPESEIQDDEGNAYHTVEPPSVDASTSQGVRGGTQTEIGNALRDVASMYPGVDFRVHGTPSEAVDLKGRINPDSPYEGLNDAKNGVQYGFTENIGSPQRAREVAVHEIVGHYGVDKILAKEHWQGIQQHVMQNGGKMRDSIMADYGSDANRVAREYVARVAENTNLDPSLWQKVMAGVRSALRAAGIRREWSDAEIQDLVRRAHENLKRGDGSTLSDGFASRPADQTGSTGSSGNVEAARLRPATPAEQQEHGALSAQHAISTELITSTQKARMADLARRMPTDTSMGNPIEQPVRDAYNILAARSGMPAVAISDLARESGRPLPEVQELLKRGHDQGKVVLSLGDSSLSDTAKREAAIDTPAQKGNLLARFNSPEAIDPSLPRPMLEAAAEQEKGNESLLGYVSRGLQRNFGASNTPELSRAREKAVGLASHLGKEASGPLRALLKEGDLTDPQQQAGTKYLNSGGGIDAEREMRATVPKPQADYFAKVKTTLQPEGTKTIAKADTPEHAAVLNKSENRYVRRAYEIDTNGPQFLRKMARGEKDPNIKDAVAYLKTQPSFKDMSDSTAEMVIRQGLADRARGLGFTGEGGQKISQALYIAKKDLTPPEWDLMQSLRSDSRISTHDQGLIQDAVRDGHLTPATQERLGAIADGGALSKDESAMLSEIAAKDTVHPAMRALFGEHTNPIEQAAYTMQKLIGSVRQAETINQIADAETSDGRKLSYATPKDYEDALKATTGDTRAALLRYKPLPSSDGYGKLSGRISDIGVHDALDSMNRGMDAGGNAILGKIQKVMKLNATVLNASTHAHWWMQMPLMFSMGRVYNPGDWWDAAKIVLGKNSAHDAIREELTRNGVTETGAAGDAGAAAKQFSSLNQPTSILGKIKTGGDKAVQFLGQLYSHPDEIIRTATYLKAKERALASGMTDAKAQNHAIDFTNRYTFNYKALPRGVSALSNTPGINPFLGYSAELTRITNNLAQDVLSGTSEDRLHAALNLGLMAAVPLAASLGSQSTNLSAKDQKDWDRMRNLEDVDKRGQIKFVLGRDQKTGAFHYIDVAPLVPAGDTFTMAKDILKGDWKSFAADQPLVGLAHSPLASLGIDLSTGTNQGTGQKLFTAGDYAQRIAQPLLPPLTPFVGSQAQRIARGFTPNQDGGLGLENPRTGRVDNPTTSLLGAAGIRIQSEQPGSLMRAAQADAQDERNAAKSKLMQIVGTKANAGAQQSALLGYTQRIQDINRGLMQKTGP